jgi:ubiquinone/menaquinone biosynthesis C-methylase UbiE
MKIHLDLGNVEVSQAAANALQSSGVSLPNLLHKYQNGNWNDEGEAAQRHNEFAAQNGLLVAAEYRLPDEQGILIVTAQDRSRTRVLLPEEFEYLEVSVTAGYAHWARSYDEWKNPLIALEQPVVTELLDGLAFQTALEVGVGTGRHALRLAQRAVSVVGCDLSSEMLKVAKNKKAADKQPLELVQASLEASLPFPGDCFDLVLCSLVLSHVTGLQACFREFARVQTHSGFCLISAYHPEAIAVRWRTSILEPEGALRLPNMPHTREDYLEGLQAAGYRIQQVLDLRVKDTPAGYFAADMVAEHGERWLCLVILAEYI